MPTQVFGRGTVRGYEATQGPKGALTVRGFTVERTPNAQQWLVHQAMKCTLSLSAVYVTLWLGENSFSNTELCSSFFDNTACATNNLVGVWFKGIGALAATGILYNLVR